MDLRIYRQFHFCLLVIFIVNLFISPQARAISILEEEKLGREFNKIMKQRLRLIQDPLIVDYVNQVGQKLVSVFPNTPFKYHFYVVDEPVYNAFAGPGGYVFINSGLMMAMDSETDLAGILGHEISHVYARHLSKRIGRSGKIGVATIAGVLAGALLGASGAGAAAQALTVGSMAAGQSAALAYSRQDERQADELGLLYLDKAGYGGEGLYNTLRKIQAKKWYTENDIPTYVTTHPGVEERLAYTTAWLQTHPAPPEKQPAQDMFPLIKARLIGKYATLDSATNFFENRLAATSRDAIALYGLGIARQQAGERQQALALLQKAIEADPFNPYFLSELGKSYLMAGNLQKAVTVLGNVTSSQPYQPEAFLYLGRTYLALNQPDKALQTLKQLIAKRPQYGDCFYYLSEAFSLTGHQGEARFYLGKHFFSQKSYETAEIHLSKAATLLKNSPYDEEIKSLLEEIHNILKIQKEREKQNS